MRVSTAVLAMVAWGAAFGWCAERKWDYVLRLKSGDTRHGSIVVSEDAGGASLRYEFAEKDLESCVRGVLPAAVSRGEGTTLVEATQTRPGCARVRFVLRDDGTGGTREVWRDGQWQWDGFERGLSSVAGGFRP